MKKIIILISLALFLLFIVVIVDINAESPNKPEKDSTKTQHDTSNNHRGSDQLPLVVKIIQTEKNKMEADNEAKEKEEKKLNDRRIIRFNGFLIVIASLQLIVFAWQAHRLRQSVTATKEAANAAKRSTESLSRVERAYILIKGISFNLTPGLATSPHFCAGGIVSLYNAGKTPAFPLKIQAIIELRETLPIEPPQKEQKVMPGTFIIPNNSHNFSIETNSRNVDIATQGLKLFCYGIVYYKDIFGELWETGFCWQYMRNYIPEGQMVESKLNYYT